MNLEPSRYPLEAAKGLRRCRVALASLGDDALLSAIERHVASAPVYVIGDNGQPLSRYMRAATTFPTELCSPLAPVFLVAFYSDEGLVDPAATVGGGTFAAHRRLALLIDLHSPDVARYWAGLLRCSPEARRQLEADSGFLIIPINDVSKQEGFPAGSWAPNWCGAHILLGERSHQQTPEQLPGIVLTAFNKMGVREADYRSLPALPVFVGAYGEMVAQTLGATGDLYPAFVQDVSHEATACCEVMVAARTEGFVERRSGRVRRIEPDQTCRIEAPVRVAMPASPGGAFRLIPDSD